MSTTYDTDRIVERGLRLSPEVALVPDRPHDSFAHFPYRRRCRWPGRGSAGPPAAYAVTVPRSSREPASFSSTTASALPLKVSPSQRLERAKQRFLNTLSRQTGIPLWREAFLNKPMFFIKTGGASAPIQQVDEVGLYHLQITANEVRLEAANPLGMLHGLQTFFQLVRVTPHGFSVAAVTIDDAPRFAWRGLMIDSGRHFMPLDVVRRSLDGMEGVKLNVFHWHLSENQGFRIESKLYPLLQEKGSDGNFYTQAESAR